jgi:hypothetical protein
MFEILLTVQGTQIVAVCNRCIAEGADDENCAIETATLEFVQALKADGHVAAVSDPGDVQSIMARA